MTRFARRSGRTFTFRLSKPARVLFDVLRVDSSDFEAKRIGQVAKRARRGRGRVTLPRRIRLVHGRRYRVEAIAEDASGHDSRSIAPVSFRVG